MFFGGLFMLFDDFFMVLYVFWWYLHAVRRRLWWVKGAFVMCVWLVCLCLDWVGFLVSFQREKVSSHIQKWTTSSEKVDKSIGCKAEKVQFFIPILDLTISGRKGPKTGAIGICSSKSVAYTTSFCMLNFSIRISVPQTLITGRYSMYGMYGMV